ncbi:MAG: GNAT family protein [Thermomicrobiales bacterium]
MPECNDAVTIRRATPDDAQMLVVLRGLPSTIRHQPTMQYDLAMQKQLLRESAARAENPNTSGKLHWIVEHDGLPAGGPAGWISLDITQRDQAIGSIGYTLDPAFHGKRIASRAARLLVAIAFDPRGLALERLEAVASVHNIASHRVLEAAGFQREGIARGLLRVQGVRVDHYRYGLLCTDLPAPQVPEPGDS